VIDQGRIVEVSTPEDFVRSENAQVRAFLEAQYITRTGEWERKQES
jgi:hypothetical protein